MTMPVVWLLAALLAGGVAFALNHSLTLVASTLISCLLITGASLVVGRTDLRDWTRWVLLGAVAGGLMGTAVVLGTQLRGLPMEGGAAQRTQVMALVGSAGVVGGLRLSRDAAAADRRHPRDVLRTMSGLTTGLFATLVSLAFLHQGLDPARAFSSRLSTALTILVATLTVPGWLAHQLAHPSWRRRHSQALPSPLIHSRRDA